MRSSYFIPEKTPSRTASTGCDGAGRDPDDDPVVRRYRLATNSLPGLGYFKRAQVHLPRRRCASSARRGWSHDLKRLVNDERVMSTT